MVHMAHSLSEGESVRKSAARCDVAVSTAFRWRHRFLRAIKTNTARLGGIVEADKTYLLESRKGSRAWKQAAAGLPGAEAPERKPRKRGGKATKRGLSGEQVPVLGHRPNDRRDHQRYPVGGQCRHHGSVRNFVCGRHNGKKGAPQGPTQTAPYLWRPSRPALGGADPGSAFEPSGLLDGLKKVLVERALNAEMDRHLTTAETKNTRNGYGRKTATTSTARWKFLFHGIGTHRLILF